MKYKYLIICTLLFAACNTSNKKLTVIPVGVERVDSTVTDKKIQVRRLEFYLMEGYQNDLASNSYIDSFVKTNSAKRNSYFEYHMFFLKESAKTNLKTLQASLKPNGKPIDNESDFIFDYNWLNYGKIFNREKSDTGKMSASKNIKIENIPIPADTVKK